MTTSPPIQFTDGAAYERFMSPWSRSAGTIFLDWLKQKPGLDWVDIGCGNGAFTEVIVARSLPATVAAIDPSEELLATARNKFRGEPVAFSVGDAMALPYADARFDVAVMALVLFFVPDPKRGLAEMLRVTKPRGTIASYTWDLLGGGSPASVFWEVLRELGHEPILPPSSAISRFDALKALWAESGLTDIETRELLVERTFADFDDYWLAMVVSSPSAALAKLSETELAETKRRLQARLPSGANGAITVHSWATAIKGRKAGR